MRRFVRPLSGVYGNRAPHMSIRLPEELRAALMAYCVETGPTASELIREMIVARIGYTES